MKARISQHGFLWQLIVLAFLLLARPGLAETILLKNATVHTVSGQVLSPGDVLLENGKILEVGQVTRTADRVVDLKGQHLYPGLIALNTALGLVEIAAVRASSDEADTGQFIPDVRSWIAVNPDSELIPVARANGITIVEPTPGGGGLVAGQSGLIALDGWTSEKMAFKTPDALHVYWPDMNISATGRRGGGGGVGGRGRGGRGGGGSLDEQDKERLLRIKELDDYFTDARAYAQARDAGKTKGAPDPGLNPSWEAMLPYVRGQLPIMVHAEDSRQIKAALKWAATNDYKIIIAGGRDAWMAADLLAKAKVPVIYDGVYTMPARDFEPYDVHYKAPEILRQAGVKVIFSIGAGGKEPSEDPSAVRNLPYAAALAVAFGLPAEEALKGITLYPAQIMGVDDRLGSIETGKDATLFACDGDILDLRANVKHVWIAGHEVSLETRHTRLYDKYRNRPKP
ncbi:MAG: amidohydrolase family protein [Verrucomicrobiota bacterium]|jgi:imidazolonepropionase-like amidohydrolase